MWIGNRNLGRFWSIGPQYTLYVPAPWMQVGATHITFFDLQSTGAERLTTATEPIFGVTTNTRERQ
jgi:beta-galactosidase